MVRDLREGEVRKLSELSDDEIRQVLVDNPEFSNHIMQSLIGIRTLNLHEFVTLNDNSVSVRLFDSQYHPIYPLTDENYGDAAKCLRFIFIDRPPFFCLWGFRPDPKMVKEFLSENEPSCCLIDALWSAFKDHINSFLTVDIIDLNDINAHKSYLYYMSEDKLNALVVLSRKKHLILLEGDSPFTAYPVDDYIMYEDPNTMI